MVSIPNMVIGTVLALVLGAVVGWVWDWLTMRKPSGLLVEKCQRVSDKQAGALPPVPPSNSH